MPWSMAPVSTRSASSRSRRPAPRAAIVYHFRDPGPGFDRQDLPQAALSNPADDPLAHVQWRATHAMRPGGFGILLSKQLVDELVYNEAGNEVLLIKYME